MASAVLSDDGLYRYSLTREIGPGRGLFHDSTGILRVLFVMLNPSTADATNDDPTIRRCIRFARDWGYTTLGVVNLYAYRATEPVEMMSAHLDGVDVVGPENTKHVEGMLHTAPLVVAAWGGSVPIYLPRSPVLDLMRNERRAVHCVGKTMNGHPRHPLYVRKDKKPEPYSVRL